MKSICAVPGTIVSPTWYAGISELLILLFVLYYIYRFWSFSTKEKLTTKWFMRLFSLFSGFLIFIVGSLIVGISFIFIFGDDNPPSYQYHNLNAAVKNTCFLDPRKINCPKTPQDLINIQPQQFIPETAHAHLTYQYYPATNDYTLIIRNDDYVLGNNNRVAIFDSRLPKDSNYAQGLDFADVEVTKCGDKYSLINPPSFPGPWNAIN
ncbi:hypothetical protein C5B42_00215 [Candidatus Cerribacteria bacterium 'Amazon FNV 2010 28 9']|uniref:Uncharacterized protein n=1 Tax=Candidatus Cerribacteria bacterium 'Amazon FNV 2010 28 9' TaxID=2081795 RepID=A0A317JQP4_9BACT|nr:MAG: hypothetical protein C5B42_00215 [Candidatus Cerribacteria bacterium 'Amazon FNV 2010 28 9']